MITAVCNFCNNYFPIENRGGEFEIRGGKIALPFILTGQYFRISGSVLNDGVYQYTDELTLTDEVFHGFITSMKPPKDFLKLVEDISAYVSSDAAKPSPYISESFGSYSYSKAVSSKGVPDNAWETVFKTRLCAYRRVRGI